MGFVNGAIHSQCTFAFFGFLGQDVTLERLLVSDLAGAGYFKTLLGTGVCFYLGHFLNAVTVLPLWRSSPEDTYGATSGNIPF